MKNVLATFVVLITCALTSRADTLLQTNSFNYTGSNQSVTVPAGADYCIIRIWAAGGAGGPNTKGGGGAYVYSQVRVTPSQTLVVQVGGGGAGYGSQAGGWPGGGSAAGLGGAGGGGYTRVYSTNLSVTAGAGGGGGNGSFWGANGGGGGYYGSNGGGSGSTYGRGAQTWSGGAGGTGDVGNGSAGTALQGGNSLVNDQYVGGGGGGGWYGGGGGASGSFSGGGPGGGGGGSSHAEGALMAAYARDAVGPTPGGTDDPFYPANSIGYGAVSDVYQPGRNGFAHIQFWQEVGPPTFVDVTQLNSKESQPINYTVAVTSKNTPLTSFSASGLPAGLSLDPATRVITGTVNTPGTYTVNYTATNAYGTTSASQVFFFEAATFGCNYLASTNVPNAGEIVTYSINASAKFGISWIEVVMWEPGNLSPNKYYYWPGGNPPTFYPLSASISHSHKFLSNPGFYTLQIRVVDVYENHDDYWYAVELGAVKKAIPYSSNFDNFNVGRIGFQDDWLEWEGTSNVVSSSVSGALNGPAAASGSQSVRLQAPSPKIARLDQRFQNTSQGLWLSVSARPSATADASNSSVLDYGNAKIGFIQVSGSQTVVMVFNGNGSGGGSWIDTGKRIASDSAGMATAWSRFVVQSRANDWDLFLDGAFVRSSGVISSSAAAFNSLSFWGSNTGTAFIDSFEASTSSPFALGTSSAPTISNRTYYTATVSWTNPPSPNSSIQRTEIRLTPSVGSPQIQTVIGSGTSASVSGLTINSNYSVAVRSQNLANVWSAWSSNISFSTLADTTPPVPQGALSISGSIGAKQVKLQWAIAVDDVGLKEYELRRGGVAIYTGNALSFLDTGRTPSTAYSYTLIARDIYNNNAAYSPNPLNVTTIAGYSVTVTNGTGGGTALEVGSTVAITANAPPTNYMFSNWTIQSGAGATISNPNAVTTSVTIASANVVVQANYVIDPASDADGDGIPYGVESALGTNPNSAAQSGDASNVNLKLHRPN